MAEKRRIVQQSMSFSPSRYERLKNTVIDEPRISAPSPAKNARLQHSNHQSGIHEAPTTSIATEPDCVKENLEHEQIEIDVAGINEDDEIVIADVGTSPIEIANVIRSYNFQSNIDVLEFTPTLTQQIHSLDVIDVLTTPMNDQEMRDCMAGLCVMVNRLISENRYLLREIQSLRSSHTVEHVHRFDSLAFRKRNITHEYIYPGDAHGIPEVNFSPIVERFDLNAARRSEGAINTVRRFVKFLLENIIPPHMQSKFTLRERSGVEHLTECPPDLVYMIREISLEAVNLGEVITEEDKEKREDMSDYINKFIKYALQELRRIPRKSKRIAMSSEMSTSTNESGTAASEKTRYSVRGRQATLRRQASPVRNGGGNDTKKPSKN